MSKCDLCGRASTDLKVVDTRRRELVETAQYKHLCPICIEAVKKISEG